MHEEREEGQLGREGAERIECAKERRRGSWEEKEQRGLNV